MAWRFKLKSKYTWAVMVPLLATTFDNCFGFYIVTELYKTFVAQKNQESDRNN